MTNFKQYKAEVAKPNPKSIINSYRSFGYSLSTALADIIDNSISADSSKIFLEYKWKGSESFISISDNGIGMNLKELIVAMTPGSKDPEEERRINDLGRFGMGLKTASFSQCKSLTVATKKSEFQLIKRCWDIDHINDVEEWQLLNFISNEEHLTKLKSFKSGTTVIWEKLDRIVGETDVENEFVKGIFYREIEFVKEHLRLVFHKFLEKGKIEIYFNGIRIDPWNPFLYDLSVKPEMGQVEVFKGNVEVVYYILPHMSRISSEEYDNSGGPLGWFNQQGFYVYRGDRLLVAGDWLGVEKKRDYSKLARISINFPNTNDFDWGLDIKKSTATPPIELRKELSRIARIAIKKSASIYNWRGQKTHVEFENKEKTLSLWYDVTNRDGIKKYKINRKHPMIDLLLKGENSQTIKRVLKMLEDNIPLELILYNQNEDPSFHELEKIETIPSNELIELSKDLYKGLINNGIEKELAKNQVLNSFPFNNYPLISNYLK